MATLYGLDSNVAIEIDMSSKAIDVSLVEVAEGVLGSNVLIGLNQTQFTALLEISSGDADSSGQVTLNDSTLRDILADVIDNNTSSSNFSVISGSVNGTDVSSYVNLDNSGGYASEFVNLSDVIAEMRARFKGRAQQDLKDKIAAKAAQVSLSSFRASGISANLLSALGNAGLFTDLDTAFTDTSFLGEAGLTANQQKDNDDFIATTDATTGQKMALFNALADANILTDDDLGFGTDVSLADDFAIGCMLKLKGGLFANIGFSSDVSFVDETGTVIATAEANTLRGNLRAMNFSTGMTVADFSPMVTSNPTVATANDTKNSTADTDGAQFVPNPTTTELEFPVLFVKVGD